MKREIEEKTWNPKLESHMRKIWEDEDLYRFEPNHDAYTIDTPPPYPSGRPWHIGAAAHYAQIDMIARTARMSGKNVYFPIGIDRNGLPVEMYTEKKHGIRMRETERSRFIELCKEALDDLEEEMIKIMRGLGISGLIDTHYRTDSQEYRALTQSTFIDLWNKGRIYLATRPNNYDWASGTTIADAEVLYQDIPSDLVHMKFGGEMIIASTRPELLCACQAVIVNPADERYRDMIGKTTTLPIFGRAVPIIGHPSAQMDFGTGAVMICSYGDRHDVELFRELKLEEIISIGMDGRMTAAAGPYKGLRPKQARSKIVDELERSGYLEKVEKITHRTPISERSKVPVEIIPMDEYYLKQTDRSDRMKKLACEIRFHPPMHRQILLNWLDSISIDWPISRRRYYGTEIPIWYCRSCSKPHVPKPGGYYQPWKDKCPIASCIGCGSSEFDGEQRTFDTWMDSSGSPLFVSRFGRDQKFHETTYPTAIRPQAKDIVRTWLYYTLLKCDMLTGVKPWSEAWIMGYGLDERGLKMSKSKGNAIDPLPIIETLGADSFRFWSASEVNHGYDFRCNEQKILTTRKFLSKLWNIARFISRLPDVQDAVLTPTDTWILAELDRTVAECATGYGSYNFFVPATAVREFTRNVFAAQYIEMVKARAYGDGFSAEEKNAAIHTLHLVLGTILKLLAPITPFITDYLWRALYSNQSIHKELLPQGPKPHKKDVQEITQKITEFNSKIWNLKKSKGLSLKDTMQIEIPPSLAPYKKDLKNMHNAV